MNFDLVRCLSWFFSWYRHFDKLLYFVIRWPELLIVYWERLFQIDSQARKNKWCKKRKRLIVFWEIKMKFSKFWNFHIIDHGKFFKNTMKKFQSWIGQFLLVSFYSLLLLSFNFVGIFSHQLPKKRIIELKNRRPPRV